MRSGGRLMVVSPHLDDAVFGCGELMARIPGSLCVTVFAGLPEDPGVVTDWDRDAGYESALEALACRRGEDAAALRVLDAEPQWLPFTDDQYGEPLSRLADDIASTLDALIVCHQPGTVAIPLGLFHRDHEATHRAALEVLEAWPGCDWLAYEDALYRRIPGLLEARLAALVTAGLRVDPLYRLPVAANSIKRQAVRRYDSQLRALARPSGPGYADLFAPEVGWRLRPSPRGRQLSARARDQVSPCV